MNMQMLAVDGGAEVSLREQAVWQQCAAFRLPHRVISNFSLQIPFFQPFL